MHRPFKILIALITLFISSSTFAQYQAWPLKDSIKPGKVFDSSEIAKLKSYYSSINNTYIGQFYKSFAVTTLDSNLVDNNSCRGKVTLLVFWLVTAHFEYEELNKVYDSLRNNPSFQMVAITFERNLVPEYLKTHDVHFPIAYVRWESDLHDMNYRNGFPSYAIVDKNVKLAFLSKPLDFEAFKASSIIPLLNNLLDKK